MKGNFMLSCVVSYLFIKTISVWILAMSKKLIFLQAFCQLYDRTDSKNVEAIDHWVCSNNLLNETTQKRNFH